MSLDRPDHNHENPQLFDSLLNSILGITGQLREAFFFKEIISSFQYHIIPILRESFEMFPQDEQKAGERFILKIVYIYFFYRNYPPISSGPQYIQTDLDRFLKAAAALTLTLMETEHPEILASSRDFQKIPQNLLEQEKNEGLGLFDF